jgi:inosine kinase
MKFPGQRKTKHYFPVHERDPLVRQSDVSRALETSYITGIDQTLVDIEAKVDRAFLARFGLIEGESNLLDNATAEALSAALEQSLTRGKVFAGGTIANTIHNYSVLSDSRSVLLGVMSENIAIGGHAYRYLCNTSSKVDLNGLQPVNGPIGRCFTLISEDGQRTFGISGGMMNYLRPDFIPADLIQNGCALVLSSYLVRASGDETITEAAMLAINYAKQAGVPVVLTLGTKYLIQGNQQWWLDFIEAHVDILAMNEEEGQALTGESEPLLAIDKALLLCDLVLCTAGPVGLYMGGYCDKAALRESKHELSSAVIEAHNRYEFSRAMRRSDCDDAVKIFSHIAPFMGGPSKIKNTNGAGDGALSAILHDIVSNRYHRLTVPDSEKHLHQFLSYSSLAQMCKYANRVSYEVLNQHSPRLSHSLPEREDCLEEAYWDI